MISIHSTSRRAAGFSLLEVLVAVVVLATGLLALAALQGSLTRSSAEAKVRGRVAATLSARLDELRSTGYDTLATGSTSQTSTNDPCGDGDTTDWLDCTRSQASLGSLTLTQNVAIWSGPTSFTQTAPTAPTDGQFKRVTLRATWTDATGGNHQMSLASDISGLSLTNNLIPPPEDSSENSRNPIVRTTNPATEGVIPVALGNGQSSAASNPTPELVGQQNNQEIVGTRFNVLTYTPEGNAAIIQRRFETEVIKCSCQYGAGGTKLPAIYQTAQWPAIWTGERYEVYKPDPVVAAPGQALASGPKSGVVQSKLCQECCRDHHDLASGTHPKFDPERTDGSVSKYNPNGANTLVIVPDTSSATYVNSCRLIRVDGLWRTTSDMYSRKYALLETEVDASTGDKAVTGLPTTAAKDAYGEFVKKYSEGYAGTVATTGTAPTDADADFDNATTYASFDLNTPASVGITTPSSSDYRYLHGRGLYIDYLEPVARDYLEAILADDGTDGRCPSTLSSKAECILPFLPFTSANLTEIARWVASDTSVLTVNSGNLLALNPTEPSGGRTVGLVAGIANNTSIVRASNSGVAVNTVLSTLGGVDPTDHSAEVNDVQEFNVGGTSSGESFYVEVSGGGLNPQVLYNLSSGTYTGECFKNAGNTAHRCADPDWVLPLGGSVTVGKYNNEDTQAVGASTAMGSVKCVYNGTEVTIETTAQGKPVTIAVPRFHNYVVSTPAGGTVSDDDTMAETTVISYASIAKDGTLNIGLTEQTGSPTLATMVSCEASQQGNKYFFLTAKWNKPWE